MKTIVVIKASLNQDSVSAQIADRAIVFLGKHTDIQVQTIDLRTLKMEFCDGRDLEEYNEDMRSAAEMLEKADGYLIAMPVYCYSFSGVLKNFLDITCEFMGKKPFGIMMAAGGTRSYLACQDLIKVLSFETEAFHVPCKPIQVTGAHEIEETKIVERLHRMCELLMKYS